MAGAGQGSDLGAGDGLARMLDDETLAPGGTLDRTILASLFDAMPHRVVACDADQRYVYANRQALDMLGLGLADVLGRTVEEIVGPAVAERVARLMPDLTRGLARQWSDWAVYSDGSRRYVEQIYSPCLRNGELIGYLAIISDITELKRREEDLEARIAALDEAEAINTAVIKTSIDPIVVMDEEGILLDLNPAAMATFGYSRRHAIGRPVAELIVPPAQREAHRAALARYAATGIGRLLDTRIVVDAQRADGTILPVEMTISEIRLPRRRIFTAHLRDLTAARLAEAELERQRERLHQAEKLSAMGSLLAGVAHELNNPLAILVAQSTLLVETSQDPDQRRRAERIHAAAERAGRIVKSFLAMARQRPEKREPADLNDLVRASVDMLAYGLRSHGVELTQALQAGLPTIVVDHDFIGQVIANLIINAQHALAERAGPRRIRIATRGEGARVVLEISDNGPGVPEALAARIFEPYFTTKPAGVGTGIGLSICKTVVEAHGGTITLGRSKEGGALFSVSLPAVPAAQGAAEAGPSAARGYSVLVVDDEADVRESLAEMLEHLGHRVLPILTAREALEAADLAADLAFVDLRMPGIDGLAFRDAVAARHPALADRIVIMTGDAVEGPAAVQRHGGARTIPILEKPFTLADVRRVLSAFG